MLQKYKLLPRVIILTLLLKLAKPLSRLSSCCISCMIIRKLIITRFLSFNIVVQYNSDTMDFWCLFCSLTTQLECIAATFIWIVYQLDVAGVFFTQSTYFYQVYDDNRWWTSWYQTLRKGGTTSWKFCRHWHCQTQPFRRCDFFRRWNTSWAVQIHKRRWWLPTAGL